jgi:hypothetical protein
LVTSQRETQIDILSHHYQCLTIENDFIFRERFSSRC